MKLTKILYGLIAIFFPTFAFAQTVGLGMPAPSDRSVELLSYVFGVVNGVLHGGGSQIMGQMFAKFNSAMLILCGLVITYTTIIGILQTAQEGEFLGKKYASFFIPMRTALGIILIAPTSTGYSWIQVIFIWIVLQGVAAANAIWSAAIDYLLNGGAIIVQNQNIDPASSPQAQAARNLISQMTPAVSCLMLTQRAIDETVFSTSGGITPPSQSAMQSVMTGFSSAIQPIAPGGSHGFAPFGPMQPITPGTQTGVTFNVPMPNFSTTSDSSWAFLNGMCGTLSTQANQTANQNQVLGLKTIMTDLSSAIPSFTSTCNASCYDSNYQPVPCPAGRIVPNDGALCSNGMNDCYPNGLVTSPPTVNPYGIGHPDQTPILSWCNNSNTSQAINWSAYSNLKDVFNMATLDYLGLTFNGTTRVQNSLDPSENYNVDTTTLTQAKEAGWIAAGAYYFALLQTNTSAQYANSSGAPFTVNAPGTTGFSLNRSAMDARFSNAPTDISANEDKFITWLLPFFSDNADQHSPNNGLVNIFVNNQGTPSSENQNYGHLTPVQDVIYSNGAQDCHGNIGCTFFLWPLFPYIEQMLHAFDGLNNAQAGNNNPIIMMMMFGSGMMSAAVTFWLVAMGIMFGLAIAFAAVPFVALGTGVEAFAQILAPFLSAILLPMFVVGAMLVFYLPAVPFMIFTFAAIGWIVGVIEAMIAGPIVAFGIMHPEGGNDIFGKSDPALMILLNLFLRPSLMIFGLISGIMVSYVGVWMINDGWAYVMAFVNTVEGYGWASIMAGAIIGGIAFPIIYLIMVMQVINRSFELIHLFPDKILRWLSGGLQEAFGSEFAAGAKEAKQAMHEGMDATKGAGMGAVESAKTTKDTAKAQGGSKKEDGKKTEVQGGGGGGGGVGAGGGGAGG